MKLHQIILLGALSLSSCSKTKPGTSTWVTPVGVFEGTLGGDTVDVDHFQFYLRDAALTPTAGIVTDFPQIGPTFGAEATTQDQFFLISTSQESGHARVRLITSLSPPNVANYQFVGCLRFRVSSGRIVIDGYDTEEVIEATIPRGDYSCFICSLDGMDHDIILVPSKAPRFGQLSP